MQGRTASKTGAVATAGGTAARPVGRARAGNAGESALPGSNPPGTARVGGDPKPDNPDSLANQADALRKVQIQKLRTEGLKVQADAQAAFGRGETDLAIQMLSTTRTASGPRTWSRLASPCSCGRSRAGWRCSG